MKQIDKESKIQYKNVGLKEDPLMNLPLKSVLSFRLLVEFWQKSVSENKIFSTLYWRSIKEGTGIIKADKKSIPSEKT